MSKYDLAGTHVLNKFVWSRLQKEFNLSINNYEGLIPVVPSQQIPVFNNLQSGNPFIVYTYINSGYDTEFWAGLEQVTYTIYGDIENQLRAMSNFLVDLLKRYDITALEINDFIANGPVDSDDQKFDFKYTEVVSAVSPEPFESENGRQATSVAVRLCYTHLLDQFGMRI